VIIAVIIFYLSVILSTYVGINRGQAVQTHLRFSFFLPLFIACGYYIVNDEKQITVLIKLILIGCTLLSISILWEIMFGEYEQYGFDFQYVTGFAMIYFLFKIILKGGGSVSDYIILLINTIPISISFTKPVIIPLVVAVLLISLMVIYNSSMKIKFRSVFVFIVFVIAIFSISISSNSPEIFINKIERRILKGGYITNSQVVLGQDIWSGRLDLWEQGWVDFLESPIVGNGLGYVADVYYLAESLTPHNLFVEYLAMLGILGFIPFMVVLIWVVSKLFYKNYWSQDYYLIVVSLYCFFVFHILGNSISTMMTRRPHQELIFYLLTGIMVKMVVMGSAIKKQYLS